MVTMYFQEELNAYSVQESDVGQDIIGMKNLMFPHPLISVQMRSDSFISLINHERNEFTG